MDLAEHRTTIRHLGDAKAHGQVGLGNFPFLGLTVPRLRGVYRRHNFAGTPSAPFRERRDSALVLAHACARFSIRRLSGRDYANAERFDIDHLSNVRQAAIHKLGCHLRHRSVGATMNPNEKEIWTMATDGGDPWDSRIRK